MSIYCLYIYICVYMCICVSHMYNLCMCIYIYVYVYIYMYMYIYIYMYIIYMYMYSFCVYIYICLVIGAIIQLYLLRAIAAYLLSTNKIERLVEVGKSRFIRLPQPWPRHRWWIEEIIPMCPFSEVWGVSHIYIYIHNGWVCLSFNLDLRHETKH